MTVSLFPVPYDSGQRGARMGAGPEHLLRAGLPERLRADGHGIDIQTIEKRTAFVTEVGTQFDLYRQLAEQVSTANGAGNFPLILSGNCGATIAAVARGNRAEPTGLVWFDAHLDFNTPETSGSGFLDGMSLAVILGHCWRPLAATVPPFTPLPGENVLHLGSREFDPGERERLEQTGAEVMDAAAIAQLGVETSVQPALEQLRGRVESIHLHLDLDVLNPAEAQANEYSTGTIGLAVADLMAIIQRIKLSLKIRSTTVSAYDPAYDPDGKTAAAAIAAISQLLR